MRQALPLPLALLALPGCQTTTALNGAAITYAMPRTDAKAIVTSVLTSCENGAVVETEAELVGVPGVDERKERFYSLTGDQLASQRIKRNVTVSVADNGVIAAVNSEAEDRTPQIIGNVLKLGTSVISTATGLGRFLEGDRVPKLLCSKTAEVAIERRKSIARQIAALNASLGPQTSYVRHREIRRHIDNLAVERQNILAYALTVRSEVGLTINPPNELVSIEQDHGPVSGKLDFGPYLKWFAPGTTPDQIARLIPLSFPLTALDEPAASAADLSGLRPCGLSMKVPAARLYRLKALLDTQTLAAALLPIAQTQSPAEVCLDVGFGEKRTIDLSFDAYGRATKFGIQSAAQAEAATAGLLGITDDAGGFVGAVRGPDRTARRQSEIDRLKTLQEYNALKACEAILEAGGTDCSAKDE